MYSKCYHDVNRRIVSFLFCLPFANRASVSGDLYIDFDWNHLIFPVAYFVCQVTTLFIIPSRARIWIAYHISHIMHVLHHVACAFPVIDCGSIACVLLWVEPGDKFVNEEPVEYAYEDQAFDNSENLTGKMTIPSKSLLSLLYELFALLLPTTCYIMPPIWPCQPLTILS